ncbi:MAG TPA: acyl-CoA dehydrogenase family protein [Frankiaceae bacterium]|nr:acyl-CoA dehydrogenase family protein [Frankiaceae bacterium]
MDLSHSAADEQFRREFQGWLEANLPREWRGDEYWAARTLDEGFELRREWERNKALAGWAGINWPSEFGGRGGTATQKAIYDEEMARARAPQTVNNLGLTFLAPTVMAIGTDAQKRDIIPALLRNDVIWCQGFSEPGAGSDLAALSTRGELQGDEFVVNGQKVWTSNALHADKMFALVRTDSPASSPVSGAKKHHGITMLLLDLDQPGVDIRPLKQMTGKQHFGEVFLTDARAPADQVLGQIGGGWDVAMLLLSFERGASALGYYATFRRELEEIVQIARRTPRGSGIAADDPMIRQKIAQAVVELEALKLHSLHILTKVERGEELGFESSMTKLQWSETHQDIGELYMDVVGPQGWTTRSNDGAYGELFPLQESALWARSETIWGGSSQVQRNIVAERVLGLPR